MSDPGDVEIRLGADRSDVRVLRCSLAAYRGVNALAGGYTEVMQQIARCNTDIITSVVLLGLGAKTKKEIDTIERLIYEAGVTTLAGPCIDYLTRLSNGGRPPAEDPDGSEEKKDESGGNGEAASS